MRALAILVAVVIIAFLMRRQVSEVGSNTNPNQKQVENATSQPRDFVRKQRDALTHDDRKELNDLLTQIDK
jgi:hypothetical protein